MLVSSVIAKPTRECNADCSYCSAPPESGAFWSIAQFKAYFDRVLPVLHKGRVDWIWHGGEPMLLTPDFYWEAADYARSKHSNISFTMQTNLLRYGPRWRDLIVNLFDGRVSTSFDPGEDRRSVGGSSTAYYKAFRRRIEDAYDDGFAPLIVSVISDENAPLVKEYVEHALTTGKSSIRLNHMYPAGRLADSPPPLSPNTYTDLLLWAFDEWVAGDGDIDIVPVSQMLDLCLGIKSDQCPWTRSCGQRFLHIDPDGKLYSCGSMADLEDESLCYGNLNSISDDSIRLGIHELFASRGARKTQARVFDFPQDCASCPQFDVCRGGCQRDAELYGRGLGGKFYYCDTWKTVFGHIKNAIASGRIDDFIKRRQERRIRWVA